MPINGLERFEEFWSVYPKKDEKKECKKKWAARKFDDIADFLIADVKNRVKNDSKWIDGFAPLPKTYLNGDRWEDDIREAVRPVGAVNPADYIIPMDWKERGLEIGLKPNKDEKYVDFRSRVVEREDQ